MLKKVKEACSRFNLLENAGHITGALSGGADSMALLYALFNLKDELGIQKLSAAHFNHQIRGAEALRDQNFVEAQCKKLGVELYLGSADVPSFAKEHRLSMELAARELRYEFFDSIDTDAIATAHTASDNIETVIFNIARGTALSGLCGIPPKRLKYIRPLILCTRGEIENYCAENKIEFVTDSTNLCDDYTRNKIRHSVVPVLKSFNASAETAVSRMTATIREDEDFINSVAQKQFDALFLNGELSVKNFKELHPAIAKRVIAKYLSAVNTETDNFHINRIYEICLSGGKTSIADNKTAAVRDFILKIEPEKKPVPEFEVKFSKQKNDLFQNNKKVHNLLLKNILDCDRIVGTLVVRGRAEGDRVRLKNKNCTKTLKKLFCEYKIPNEQRSVWPVIADDLGVVWIYKIGVADRCAVDESSQNIYKISVEKCFKGDN